MQSKEKFDPTIPNAQCATTKWLKASHFNMKTFCVIVPDLHQPMDCYTEWRCIKNDNNIIPRNGKSKNTSHTKKMLLFRRTAATKHISKGTPSFRGR